jgi:hypothetical protein
MKEITENTPIRTIDSMFLFDDDKELKISLKKTHEYQPIELITITHFLLTHLQTKDDLTLHINLSTEDTNNIQKNFFDYYIIVCCILYKKNLMIKNLKGQIIYTDDLYQILISKLKSQEELYARDLASNHIKELKSRFFSPKNKSKNEEGLSFLIPCFDHLQDYGLDRSNYFYNSIKPKGPRDIAVWFERLFTFNDLNISLPHIFYDLSIVINELIQNTHDWARTSFDNEEFISPNIRACSVNVFLENRLSIDNSYDHIHEYLKLIRESKKEDIYSPDRQIKLEFTNEKVGICEISIIDTGPGMARRWLQKDYNEIDKNNEHLTVIECFNKYFTSDNTSRTQLRGRGLSNVIGIIGYSGLIRVRTGHTLLVRNFFREKVQKQELENGRINFKLAESGLPLVGGTTISILYPFVYTSNVAIE